MYRYYAYGSIAYITNKSLFSTQEATDEFRIKSYLVKNIIKVQIFEKILRKT